MGIFGLIATFLPLAVQLAEDLFGKGQGANKKAAVINDVSSAVSAWAGASKGGQKATALAVQQILTMPVYTAPDGTQKDIIEMAVDHFVNTTAPGGVSGTGVQSEG